MEPPMNDHDQTHIARELLKTHLQATVEEQFKSVGYLLVAHGGALVSCVTLIKEKSSIPGIQIFTSLFAYGFLAAIFAYGFTTALSQAGRMQFIDGYHKWRFLLPLRVSFVFMSISALLLLIGVLLVSRSFGAF
jgi:hypothetical protein